MTYESLYANAAGRTSRTAFVPALIVLLLAAAFYEFVARAGRNGEWVLVTLLFPGVVLLARRLHDMGQSGWLLLLPGGLIAAAVWLHMAALSPEVQPLIDLAALVVTAGSMLWGLIGKGQETSNAYGEAQAD